MKCLNCKEEIYEFDFCPHCGTPISEIAKQVEIKKNTKKQLTKHNNFFFINITS